MIKLLTLIFKYNYFRFISELFKQQIIYPNVMFHCIIELINKYSDESLECLCVILKTAGKEIEQVKNYTI